MLNIYITKPEMPAMDEFKKYIEHIWETRQLTNGGMLHRELENKLCEYLGVNYISLFSNATLALTTALRYFGISGDVITTPFSFVATSHAIIWANLKPKFVDIESGGFNIDPDKIENSITENTSAIMPVHCYGFPCNVERISEIAEKHKLKVIYDAAHAFGVKLSGNSILNYGDISVLSFHATKVFSTFEGGAIISKTKEEKDAFDSLKNFGISESGDVEKFGINAKMSEIHSAFGLANINNVDHYISQRLNIEHYYNRSLRGVNGIRIFERPDSLAGNGGYYPILIEEDYAIDRDEVFFRFKKMGIFTRRYFYPLINEMPPYKDIQSLNSSSTPNAKDMARKILCLPIYPSLGKEIQNVIIEKLCSWGQG
jgi:dTDP-4-amino-4,6-dideoxygalactose transaminase